MECTGYLYKKVTFFTRLVRRNRVKIIKKFLTVIEKRTEVMKLKNVLIVVEDIERSVNFYQNLFGLEVIVANDANVILTEGLVLQDKKVWEKCIGRDVIPEHHCCELYFEEKEIEAFAEKLAKYCPTVKYVNQLMTYPWGKKVMRFYDPDGNLIEVGTPLI